jgi:hypothetical protein
LYIELCYKYDLTSKEKKWKRNKDVFQRPVSQMGNGKSREKYVKYVRMFYVPVVDDVPDFFSLEFIVGIVVVSILARSFTDSPMETNEVVNNQIWFVRYIRLYCSLWSSVFDFNDESMIVLDDNSWPRPLSNDDEFAMNEPNNDMESIDFEAHSNQHGYSH